VASRGLLLKSYVSRASPAAYEVYPSKLNELGGSSICVFLSLLLTYSAKLTSSQFAADHNYYFLAAYFPLSQGAFGPHRSDTPSMSHLVAAIFIALLVSLNLRESRREHQKNVGPVEFVPSHSERKHKPSLGDIRTTVVATFVGGYTNDDTEVRPYAAWMAIKT
jgi:hypothetical protein